MSHTAFHHLFPEIASKETRVITITDTKYTGLPEGQYALLEFYCTDLGCDCRNVYIMVTPTDSTMAVATISYGWEDFDYYKNWMGESEENEIIKDFKGPALAPLTRQSRFSNQWLSLFTNLLNEDKIYANRFKRHYELVKSSIEEKK